MRPAYSLKTVGINQNDSIGMLDVIVYCVAPSKACAAIRFSYSSACELI